MPIPRHLSTLSCPRRAARTGSCDVTFLRASSALGWLRRACRGARPFRPGSWGFRCRGYPSHTGLVSPRPRWTGPVSPRPRITPGALRGHNGQTAAIGAGPRLAGGQPGRGSHRTISSHPAMPGSHLILGRTLEHGDDRRCGLRPAGRRTARPGARRCNHAASSASRSPHLPARQPARLAADRAA